MKFDILKCRSYSSHDFRLVNAIHNECHMTVSPQCQRKIPFKVVKNQKFQKSLCLTTCALKYPLTTQTMNSVFDLLKQLRILKTILKSIYHFYIVLWNVYFNTFPVG